MPKNFSLRLFVAAVVCGASCLQAAQSLSVSASYADKLVKDSETGEYMVTENGAGTISATLPLSDVDIASFDEGTMFAISMHGGQVVEVTLGDDSSYRKGKNKATFTDSGRQLTISWTATQLTISGTAKYDIFGLGGSFDGTEGKITREETEFSIEFGDFSFYRCVYISGTSSLKTKTVGGESFELRTVQVSGSADMTPPTVTITKPAANSTTTNGENLVISGKATDNVGISEVAYYLSSSSFLDEMAEFSPAAMEEGSPVWTSTVNPSPGTNYLFVKAWDYSDNESTIVKSKFFYSKRSQLNLNYEGLGKVTGATNGQWLEIGKRYTLTAKPNAGQIIAYWQVDGNNINYFGNGTTFSFEMQEDLTVTAVFKPNPFPVVKGTYTGLFYNHDEGVNLTNAGLFTLTVTSNGGFSGKLTLISGTVTLSGQLALSPMDDGIAYADIDKSRGKLPSLSGFIELDMTGSGEVAGHLYQYLESSDFSLEATFEGQLCRPATKDKSALYNLAVVPGESGPAGFGYGTATVAGSGLVTMSVNLADQISPVSPSAYQARDGSFPFFASLYSAKGVIMGWLTVTNEESTDLRGSDIVWIKQAGKSKFYPEGFEALLPVWGSRYVAPKGGSNILQWTSGNVHFENGGMQESVYTPITYNPAKNQFIWPEGNPNKIALTLTTASGMLTGNFKPQGATKAQTFKGIVLPKLGAGYGFFTGADQTGALKLLGEPVDDGAGGGSGIFSGSGSSYAPEPPGGSYAPEPPIIQ